MNKITDLDVKKIKGIFFDIDDTFSTNGKISKEAYASLWNLFEAHKLVIPITGRPAGWCDHIARMWPVTAVIGENGAFYYMMKDNKMKKVYAADASQKILYKKQLDHIREEILKTVKGAEVASDQFAREFDLAIDICEDISRLSEEDVNKVIEIFKKYGANTKLSSIHVNGWFGTYDKLTTARMFLRREMGLNLDDVNSEFVFCGDSPNDEPMFEFFDNSVGVANVNNFKNFLKHFPKYITTKKSGEGFTELAELICAKGRGLLEVDK